MRAHAVQAGEAPAFPFVVIGASQIQPLLDAQRGQVLTIVERSYVTHDAGGTVNPESCFLRPPRQPQNRIIALPAHIAGERPISGIKWIASYPDNVARGFPRASAVLILNDATTGYPFACLESSLISASRTAASAALGACCLTPSRRSRCLGVVGSGLIARSVCDYLKAAGWQFDRALLNDLKPAAAQALAAELEPDCRDVRVSSDLEEVVRSSDLLLLATVTTSPFITDGSWFTHGPAVLNISLRDLAPEVVLGAYNLVDDVDHVLRAGTTLHLAREIAGNAQFIQGTIGRALSSQLSPAHEGLRVFSPFGLGMLDIALGRWVYEQISSRGGGTPIADFFPASVP